MSYLVLARKWRPRNFGELVGQQHVLRALMNALETGRVHHAFLFTGTRGVGKTTIARILAKSLNCETGVTANPCGECGACREIDEGRFVDLIEVDAASRTKVDDTRELLDNVQYSPARGRYKVYLIDEVHMLSTHSFNALLKTLEEPPPHVKFLLATTDPQKLPVTVLSRCLQFNLKRLTPGLIQKRLAEIVTAEHIEFEPEALRLLARAAEGSMRDGLSLLDQVIAFGGAALSAADTRTMLGTIERTEVYDLLNALANRDGKSLMSIVGQLDERAPDYHGVLAEMASVLQRVALLQAVDDLELDESEDEATLRRFATGLTPEDVQLYYQIALVGRRDLDLAPDPRAGLEMILLRMLAFRPAVEQSASSRDASMASAAGGQSPAKAAREALLGSRAAASVAVRHEGAAPAASSVAAPQATPIRNAEVHSSRAPSPSTDPATWQQVVTQLNLQGPVSQLAAHCTLVGKEGSKVRLLLDANGEPFRRPALEDKLIQALSAYFGEPIKLEIDIAQTQVDTPARRQQLDAEDKLKAARTAIENDPNIRAMREVFGATVQLDSIKPVG